MIRFEDLVDKVRGINPEADIELLRRAYVFSAFEHKGQVRHSGEPYLVLAYRPFPELQPYAETGPIFLHAEECERARCGSEPPEMLAGPDYIVRGYGADDRIVYGTGAVVPTPAIAEKAEALLARDDVAYVHVRSARNNCYQCRIDAA